MIKIEHLILSVTLSLLVNISFSQEELLEEKRFEKIDFKELEKEIKEKKSVFNFEKLFQRYQSNDTSLDVVDYKHLYYGYSFQNSYSPYSRDEEAEKKVNKLLAKQNPVYSDYKAILKITDNVLKQNPFDLDMIWVAHLSNSKINSRSNAKKWLYKFDKIVETIVRSGDGLSIETAMTVIDTRHEYILLEVLGFEFAGEQSFVSKHYDYLKIKKNEFDIKGLYFNVERLFDANSNKY